jgi:hypothetical protein
MNSRLIIILLATMMSIPHVGWVASQKENQSMTNQDTTPPGTRLYVDAAKRFQFLYPDGWIPDPIDEAENPPKAVDFRIADSKDTYAYMQIRIYGKQPLNEAGLTEIIQFSKKNIEDAGIHVEHLAALPAGKNGAQRERWVGDGFLPNKRKAQLAMLFRKTSGHWIGCTLITPDESDNAAAWQLGNRFFKLLAATLKGG